MDKEVIQTAIGKSLVLIRESLRGELTIQGHPLTGRLSRSLSFKYSEGQNVFRGSIEAEDYAIYVDAGVPASRIRYPIRVMIQYFIKRGLPGKEAKRAAYATRNAHRAEGMPTRDSYRFSLNGHRKGFISRGVNAVLPEVSKIFEKEIGQKVYIELFRILQPTPEALKLELTL